MKPVKHTGDMEERVFLDLKSEKKVGCYLVYLRQRDGSKSKYVRQHQDSFIGVEVTIKTISP